MSVVQLNCTNCGYNNWQLVYGKGVRQVVAVCEECGLQIKVEELKKAQIKE